MRSALSACLAALLACLAVSQGALAAEAAGGACKSLLTLVDTLPDASMFAELLVALGATNDPLNAPPPGLPDGLARRMLRATAHTGIPDDSLEPRGTPGTPGTPGAPGSPGTVYCPTVYDPVCGVDNRTYSNDCEATAQAGVAVQCTGECPCSSGGGDGGIVVDGPTGGPAVCTGDVRPVCGVDDIMYTNVCQAEVAGVDIACLRVCPCPDPIEEAQTGGGMVLVPTDDALLGALDALNATDGWLNNTELLHALLARHVILRSSQQGLEPSQDVQPTLAGLPVTTEAGQALELLDANKMNPAQALELLDANKMNPAQVLLPGASGEPASITMLQSAVGCRLLATQIGAVLEGPQPAV